MPETPDIRFFRDSVEGRRGEILDAALRVFNRHGFDGGTMREIAEEVGVSEPALYRHFAGKEDLFEQLIAEAGGRIRSELLPLIETASPDDIREIVRTLAADGRRAASAYLPVIQTIMIASVHNEHFLEVYRNAFATPLTAGLTDAVRKIDRHYGVTIADHELPGRVHTLISLFVGHFVTSFVLEEGGGPLEDLVVRVMGWSREHAGTDTPGSDG